MSKVTGLDYFGARYFSAAQGRWTTPDWSGSPEPVPYANLWDPQSLNLYGYVLNNPLAYVDLDGHSGDGCTWDMQKAILTCPQPPVRDLQAEAIAQWYQRMQREREQNKPKKDQPIYGPQGQGTQVLQAAGQRADHDLACWGLDISTEDAATAALVASWPGSKKPFAQGGMPETSAASELFRDATKGAKGGTRLPTVVGGPGTGKPFKLRMTNSVGGFWGRSLTVVGIGLQAVAAYGMYTCLSQ